MLLSLSSNTGNVYVQTHFHVFIMYGISEWANKYINHFTCHLRWEETLIFALWILLFGLVYWFITFNNGPLLGFALFLRF